MRSNSVKSCAVGAMVVGGALSMTQTASAGLTWLGSGTVGLSNYDSFNKLYVGGDPHWDNAGNNALLAFSGSAGANVSSFGSETAGLGFSVGFSTDGAPGYIEVVGQRVFEVTGTYELTITLTKGFDAGFGRVIASLWKPDGDVVQYDGTGIHNVTLSAGTYMLDFAADSLDSAAYSGDFISVVAVPAPGAIALLGAAGLVGRRRRN